MGDEREERNAFFKHSLFPTLVLEDIFELAVVFLESRLSFEGLVEVGLPVK